MPYILETAFDEKEIEQRTVDTGYEHKQGGYPLYAVALEKGDAVLMGGKTAGADG